jgi:RimJ/RimL family protein N-acetyltransferase
MQYAAGDPGEELAGGNGGIGWRRVLAFVTAEEASMDAFLSVSARSRYQPQLEDYLASLLKQRFTKPDWCVVGVVGGVPVGRAALWALPGHEVPTDTVLIDADWNDPELAAGRALLVEVHDLAAAHGADALSHHVDSPPGPPQYQENEEARVRLLVESGYALLRDGLRWSYSGSSPQDDRRAPSLVFRSLPEVGEDAFVEALASTYQGTRDSWISSSIEEHGLLGAARADFRDYQGLEHSPDWWELAYAEDDTLAGVIIGAKNPSKAVVAYVGVVPEQRGRGLAALLVRRGTDKLLASGSGEIGGDCDRGNVGMVKAFQRAGFEQVGRRRSFRRDVAS